MHEELLTAAATATIAPASLPPSPVVDATTAIPSAAVTVDSNPSKKRKTTISETTNGVTVKGKGASTASDGPTTKKMRSWNSYDECGRSQPSRRQVQIGDLHTSKVLTKQHT